MKVEKAKLPFRFLNVLHKEATAELDKILREALPVIEKVILESQPDPSSLLDTTDFQKSIHVADTLKHYERRVTHGAPTSSTQLTREAALAVVEQLDWDGGTLNSEFMTASELTEGEPLLLHPDEIFGGKVRSDELVDALTKKSGVIRVVPHMGAYRCLEGGSYLLAARLTKLLAVEVVVCEAPRMMTWMGRSGAPSEKAMIAPIAVRYYDVESRYEPFMELLREGFSWSEIYRHIEGRPIAEVNDLQYEIEKLAKEKTRVFNILRENAMRASPSSSFKASQIYKDPAYLRLDARMSALLEKKLKLLEKDVQPHQQVQEAVRQFVSYCKEDEEPIELPSLEAYEGLDQEEDHKVFGYKRDEEVEVLKQKEWTPGRIIRVDPGSLLVLREDGQRRRIDDLSMIRKIGVLPEPDKLDVDSDSEVVYNDTMNDIRLDRFDVLIPAASFARKIEEQCKVTTDLMNNTPLRVNKATWERNLDVANKEFLDAEAVAIASAGRTFKVNSPKECAQLLFVEKGFPVQRTTPTGAPVVDKETLTSLEAMGYEVAGKIMIAREWRSKLSQLEKWEEYANIGFVQCHWDQLGQPMGRFTAANPNLQNRITEIRESVEPEEGWSLVSLDLGQAEYVTWASLSGDPLLQQTFKDGDDLHMRMYKEVEAVMPGAIPSRLEPRQAGKTINFALLYLMQPFILAKQLGVSIEDASKIMEAYAERAPLAIKYREELLKGAQRSANVSTHFGRIRYLTNLKAKNRHVLHEARKTAWHHHNCGTAAELLKIRTIKTWKRLEKAGFTENDVRPALNMHDELILTCKDGIVDEVSKISKAAFEEVTPGFLPFRVDQRVGKNWLAISK